MKKKRLRLGKRKIFRDEGWVSAYVQPSGKKWKRIASKRSRNADIASGANHKKTFGFFEWS